MYPKVKWRDLKKMQQTWSKFIPVEPRPANMSPGKLVWKEQRRLFQGYLPSLPAPRPTDDRFGIILHFYVDGHKAKRHPKSDLDNLVKGTIDNLKGYYWRDDSQIDEIKARINRQSKKVGIWLRIYSLKTQKASVRIR